MYPIEKWFKPSNALNSKIPLTAIEVNESVAERVVEKIRKRIAENKAKELGVKDTTSLVAETRAPLERCISKFENGGTVENNVVKDLLLKMICWRPRDRISIQDAIKSISLSDNDIILITGSLYLAGEVLDLN